MDYKGVAELSPKKATTLIEIRVIKKWVPAYREDEIHYVFVDAEGMGIQAMAKGKNKHAVEPKLKPGLCYQIHTYACVSPDNFTNTLTHSATIFLAQSTVITAIPDCTNIQNQFFDIATRRRAEMVAPSEGIVDYIGILRGMTDKKTSRNQPYVVMTLRDCSNRDVTVAVWEDMLNSKTRFNRAEYESAVPPVILALTALKTKDYYGTLQFQTTNATYTYRNPKTPQTQDLIDMYANEDLQHQAVVQPTGQEISIADLKRLPTNSLAGRNFMLKCNIEHLSTTVPWFYTACSECNQLVLENGPLGFCSQHANVSDVKYVYRIQAVLADGTETIETTFFDRTTTQLLQMSCAELMTQPNKDTLVQNLIGKDMQLQIQATRDRRGITKCTVNNATMLFQHAESISQDMPTIDTPVPKTPHPKTPSHSSSSSAADATHAKRSLMQSEDFQASPAKKKSVADPKV